jgi:ABC-type Zn uptake system ZnuABC Zn-binding protein ZnuA
MNKFFVALIGIFALVGCSAPSAPPASSNVLAAETFLADIAQNVAGDRMTIGALMPLGIDPHEFEPTPADIKKISDSRILILNGAGFEDSMEKVLSSAGGNRFTIDASKGLTSRAMGTNEIRDPNHPGDPHFWLDPNNVIRYVENIRDGLSQVDPTNAATYAANANAYVAQLKELDQWIADQVQQVPPERRVLVTNHENLGYFADRYGFKIIGTVIPSTSTGASPSAQQLAQLIDRVKASPARAVFLEIGANPQLAKQLAQETGVKIVTNLYTESLSEKNAPASTYIEMMKHNTMTFVNALK